MHPVCLKMSSGRSGIQFLIEARLRATVLDDLVKGFRFIRILWFGKHITEDLRQVVCPSVSCLQCECGDRSS